MKIDTTHVCKHETRRIYLGTNAANEGQLLAWLHVKNTA